MINSLFKSLSFKETSPRHSLISAGNSVTRKQEAGDRGQHTQHPGAAWASLPPRQGLVQHYKPSELITVSPLPSALTPTPLSCPPPKLLPISLLGSLAQAQLPHCPPCHSLRPCTTQSQSAHRNLRGTALPPPSTVSAKLEPCSPWHQPHFPR